jgi:hypothetical protein
MEISSAIPPGRAIHPKLLIELGCITIASAQIEGLLMQFLIFMMAVGHEDGMHVIAENTPISRLLQWVRTIAEQRFETKVYDKLKVLFDRIQDGITERNTYVHGLWKLGPEAETAMVQTIKMNREFPLKWELATFADLRELLIELEYIAQELHAVGVECGYFLHP